MMLLGGLGVWGYVAALGIGAVVATGATYEIVHNANAVEISQLKTDAANQRAVNATAALTQLTGFIDKMHEADSSYAGALADIDNRFSLIQKGLTNARRVPLPVDCKPDTGRVRSLTDAIAAANGSPASVSGPSGTMPTNPKPIGK